MTLSNIPSRSRKSHPLLLALAFFCLFVLARAEGVTNDPSPDATATSPVEDDVPVMICGHGSSELGCGQMTEVGMAFVIVLPLIPGLFILLTVLVNNWDRSDEEDRHRAAARGNQELYEHPGVDQRRPTMQPAHYQAIQVRSNNTQRNERRFLSLVNVPTPPFTPCSPTSLPHFAHPLRSPILQSGARVGPSQLEMMARREQSAPREAGDPRNLASQQRQQRAPTVEEMRALAAQPLPALRGPPRFDTETGQPL